ncbi:MAG TPA: hypothetical protein VN285_00390 [Candidatus Deferrimicrobium sp.]|nr:hypothetical protein [Candidatus Deferrimicrobium sp.]
MKTAHAIVTMLFLAAGLLYGTAAGQPPPIPAQERPVVLTRGPVHEAFSEPVILQIQVGLMVSNQPPADIDEIPPTHRPRGDNYVWVPGYWSWDGDRDNYIWVSGCWRAAPPNMSWVPGYWSRETGGWEWVAGFWMPADIQDLEYLPAPPASYDDRPSGRSPSRNDIWVPSCQYWYQDHYVERPGYWLVARQDWVWTPSHYIWTPRGYIFSEGHWDYPLQRRGMLFAPVYFPQSVYYRSGYSYSPSIVIDLGVLTLHLFTYPRYTHYYFGDYYDDAYLNIGIFPRYEVEQRHTWYDPTYVYDRWHHRDEPRWEDNQRHEYDLRHADRDLRPPRTYDEMETRQTKDLPAQQRNDYRMAAPLTVVVASKKTSLKFEHIDTKAQQKIVTQAAAVHTFRGERNLWESTPAPQKTVQSPTEQKGPVMSPGERKGQVTQSGETKTQTVPQREVRITQPERVKVPAPPIIGKKTGAMKTPPQPANERKYKGVVKDAPQKSQPTDTTKTKGKEKGKEKGKDKSKDKGK